MQSGIITPGIKRRLYWSAAVFVSIIIVGTIGYYFIGAKNYSIIDCLYMTAITISTVGFSEIIDLSHNPGGRLFTIFIAFSGIGISTFIISNVAAIIVSGEIQESYKKRKMSKQIETFSDHYIICGAGRVGSHILKELSTTGRLAVIVENDESKINELLEKYPELNYINGDADVEDILVKAGIRNAKGVFVSTGDDNENLVISLTAKFLNPNTKVVTRCLEAVNVDKIKRSGADSVIPENYTAALSMVSDMIRPTISGMLDKMVSDTERNFRLEEVKINEKYAGRPLSELNLNRFPNTLLMAIESNGDWVYIPKPDFILRYPGNLVVITTPEERIKLKELS